jgi:hypothetical protein
MSDKPELDVPYAQARIGSVMNYLTREFHFQRHAFDMAKLNVMGLITKTQPTSEQSVQADAFSTLSQNASSSSTSTKLALRTPLSRTALTHHTMKSNSRLETASGMNLTVGMAYRNFEYELLEGIEPDKLYRCADKAFQTALTRLASAATAEERGDAYADFTKNFGHGFVSGLKLISCASGELKTRYASRSSEQQQRHGRSVAAGATYDGVSGGASRASEWAAETKETAAAGSLTSDVISLPNESPCATWVGKCMSEWTELGLQKMSEGPPKLPDAPKTDVKAPNIPVVTPDNEDTKVPRAVLPDKTALQDDMQREQMTAEGIDKSTNWKDYQESIKTEAKQLDKNDIADPKPEADDNGRKSESAWQDSKPHGVTADGAAAASPINDVDFGAYAVYDVKFTAYADVFPALAFHAAPSRTALNLAKIHTFIMTRQLIASYLNFLASLPEDLTGGFIKHDEEAAAFERTLRTYIDYVSALPAIITDAVYEKTILRFDEMLSASGFSATYGWPVYRCFLDNFRFLSNAPYGFLLTATDADGIHYPAWNSWAMFDDAENVSMAGNTSSFPGLIKWRDAAVSTRRIVEKSYRAFPIIGPGDASNGVKPGIALAFYVPLNNAVLRNNDNLALSWWVLSASGDLLPVKKVKKFQHPDTWAFEDADPSKHGTESKEFRARTVTDVSPASNLLDVLAYEWGEYSFVMKLNNGQPFGNRRVPITLTAIDFELGKDGAARGIPMWYELPFDLIKESVGNGFPKP